MWMLHKEKFVAPNTEKKKNLGGKKSSGLLLSVEHMSAICKSNAQALPRQWQNARNRPVK